MAYSQDGTPNYWGEQHPEPDADHQTPPQGGYPSNGGTTDLSSAVGQIYKTALGRDGSPQDIQNWINGTGGDLAKIQQGIYASPEATAYGTKRTNAAPPAVAASGPTNYTLQGFDTDKLNNASYSSAKYTPAVRAFSSAIQGMDPNTTSAKDIVAKINAAGGKATAVSDDKIDFGDGYGPIDVKIDGGRGGWWFQNGEDRLGGGAQAGAGAGAGAQAGPQAGSGDNFFGTHGAPLSMDGFGPAAGSAAGHSSELYRTLMNRAGQGLNVSPDDPVIKNQVDAYRASQEHGVRNYLAEQAERAGPYSNQDTVARSAHEHADQSTSALQASLMQNELNARRAEIQQALSEEGGLLTSQDQMALQRELGLLNAKLSNKSLDNNFSLGLGGLNLGQQQINSGNDQFASNFGLNATNQANYWDAIRRGLI